MKTSCFFILPFIFVCLFGVKNTAISQINLQIPSTEIAPVIDGTIDAVWSTSQGKELGNVLVGNATSKSDFSASFKTLWDANNLYVLAVVTDDSKINDSGEVWNDDAVEIYLDINNDKLTSYGSTDYQYTFRWNDLTTYSNNGHTDGIQFKIAGTPTGYILEVKFPWTTLGLTAPHSGISLGFDIQIHDDDDGGERDNKFAWFATTDNSWYNPSLFATASLVGDIVLTYPADKPKISADKGFYQNPFDVIISSVIPGMDIYYTLDGSDPASSSFATKVSSPAVVRIDPESTQGRGKTPGVVLKARAKKVGYDFSSVVTRTYLFINKIDIQTEFPGHDWPKDTVNTQVIDLLMDSKVLNDVRYKNLTSKALTEIPSISITTDNNNLFNPSTGIYVNAYGHSLDWEVPASVELINPDGSDGFEIDAGLRIRGGYSRNGFFRKHAFRLFFRKEYGEAKLNFPLFENEGVSSFDKVDLRCSQNYSWSKGDNDPNWGESPRCTFNRDVFSRDVQRAMNQPYTRSRYYHLYINGLYWGLYQTQERSEANFGTSYLGGSDNDYDVIKKAETGNIEATDGNLNAWQDVWNLCQQGFTDNTNYYKLQGLDANGKRDPSLKVLVDIDNLIDYMNVIFYTGNFDAPASAWINQNKGCNNFYAVYNRNDNKGFLFFAHDNEHTLLVDPIGPGNGINENRVNIGSINTDWKMVVTDFSQFQPQWLHYKLSQNPEYRMRFADRAYKSYYNNGVLTPNQTSKLFLSRTYEIDTAVIAESARWGDVNGGFYTKDNSWIPMVNKTVTEWFPVRTNIVINQLKDEGLLSSINAPVFKKNNILIEDDKIEFTNGNILSIVNPESSGSIKYTVDGSDPRITGGGVSSTAVDGANLANISILQTTIVNARIFSNGNWSPIHTLKVIVDAQINGLQLTEIHYNPLAGDALSGNEFEFIELKNRGASPINLTASNFIDGIKYSFNSVTIIQPGKFIVLASNSISFTQRYGFAPFGEYQGQLDNGGEKITLIGSAGDTLISVKYNNKAPWPTTPDSLGFSLVPAVSDLAADWNDGKNWRASSEIGGSPNADDGEITILPVLVNEILSNSEKPAVDAIELYNPNDVQVNIGGWYLSDKRDSPKRWKIPAGTSIPAKGFKTFYEGHYVNSALSYNTTEFGSAFSLSSHGEDIYLFSANIAGDLTGYEHGFDFGNIETGISFGRFITSTGKEHFVPQAQVTLDQINSYPKVGPVVINQIMYNPLPGNFEYIELVNISSDSVKLYEESSLTPWKVSGIGFDFPSNITLAAGESVYLVESTITPEDFRFMNYLDGSIRIFNFSGKLKNEGEEITLYKALPQYIENSEVKTPYECIDKIEYNNNSYWPDADGNGNTLLRESPTLYGNDPANWIAAPQRVTINTYALNDGIEGISYSKQLSASGGTPPYSWSTVSGNLPTGLTVNPLTGIISGIPSQKGTFNITVRVKDQTDASDDANLTLFIKENNQPIAFNDIAITKQNISVISKVIDNDTDVDGDRNSWIVTIVSAPNNGTAVINNDKSITYTPKKDFYGNDELSYRVTDYKGSSQALLFLTVSQEITTNDLDIRVNQSSDDAEENIGTNQLYLTSTDLELTHDVQGWDQIIGIRFQNIEIPKGATITNATIQFQTDETVNSATSLTIQGENSDNPPTFSDADRISLRPKTTTSVTWQPETWDIVHEISSKQKTPDLKDIVQEIIDRASWNSGNAMALIISGTGSRIAVAYDDATYGITGAPLLHIEYKSKYNNASIPIANSGANHSAQKGSLVQLDGNLSSSSDGRSLNYHWTLASKPTGSTTVLSNPSIVNPTFVPDLYGIYLLNLMVDNGINESTVSTTSITVENHQPIANAGSDQTHLEGTLIRLNGSASSDPDGDQLTYSWTFDTKPNGSIAALSSSTVVNPSFTADKTGNYKINLIVSDGTVSSVVDQVVVNITLNQVPIADAGSDANVITGSVVVLDGSKSSDPEGSSLTYSWSIISIPTGSSATMINPTNKKPTFQTDKAGVYTVSLIVSDGIKNSNPDEVKITSIDNREPIAAAGSDQTVKIGHQVPLDGSGSYDPDGKSLTFLWSFVTKPAGSNASLLNSGTVSPHFTPDVKGLYSIRLTVNDGTFSKSDMVQVVAVWPETIISENINNLLNVYPNPFADKLVVEFNSSVKQLIKFSLYNISGILIKEFEYDSFGKQTQVLNLEDKNLIYGMYLLVMKPEIGNPKVVKLNH